MAGKILSDLSLRLSLQSAELQKGLAQSKSSIKGFSKSVGSEMKGMSNQISQSMNHMTQGMSGMLSSGLSAFKGLIGGAKGFAAAFAATGIGAIIMAITLALAGLYSYFKRTDEGADMLAVGMGYLKGIMDGLIKIITKVGEWLVKAFSDPKAAVKELWEFIKQNFINRFYGLIDIVTGGWEVIKNGAIGVGLAIKGIFSKEARAESKEYFKKMADGLIKISEGVVAVATGFTTDDIKEFAGEINKVGKIEAKLAARRNAWANEQIRVQEENAELEIKLANKKLEYQKEDGKTAESRAKRAALMTDAMAMQNIITKNNVNLAKENYEIIEATRIAEGKTNVEARKASSDALIAYKQKIAEGDDHLRKLQGQLTTSQSITEEIKLSADEQRKLSDAAYAAKTTFEGESDALRKLYDEGKVGAKEYFDILKQLENKYIVEGSQAYQDAIDKKNAEELAKEKTKQDAMKQLAVDGLFGAMSIISDLNEAAMNNELAAAGDNEEMKEQIRKKYAKKQKAMMIAEAIANTALAVISALSMKPFLPMGPIAAGIAGAMGGAQIAKIKSTPLAKGGIAYGETLATVGEYTGARSNPEIIAPLNKLTSILGIDKMNQGGGEVKFKIEGYDLVGVLNKGNVRAGTY